MYGGSGTSPAAANCESPSGGSKSTRHRPSAMRSRGTATPCRSFRATPGCSRLAGRAITSQLPSPRGRTSSSSVSPPPGRSARSRAGITLTSLSTSRSPGPSHPPSAVMRSKTNPTRGALQHQQPRCAAAAGVLRDQRLGQLVLEVRCPHAGIVAARRRQHRACEECTREQLTGPRIPGCQPGLGPGLGLGLGPGSWLNCVSNANSYPVRRFGDALLEEVMHASIPVQVQVEVQVQDQVQVCHS